MVLFLKKMLIVTFFGALMVMMQSNVEAAPPAPEGAPPGEGKPDEGKPEGVPPEAEKPEEGKPKEKSGGEPEGMEAGPIDTPGKGAEMAGEPGGDNDSGPKSELDAPSETEFTKSERDELRKIIDWFKTKKNSNASKGAAKKSKGKKKG